MEKRFNETSLPDKKELYINLNVRDITDADFKHAKRFWRDFALKNPRDFHDFHIQIDMLLLADIFANFRNKCIQAYELDSAHFLSAPGLA